MSIELKKRWKGSMTVEIAALFPVIALTFVLSIWGGFYFYDKSIISACAYETAAVGSVMAREDEWITSEALEQEFQERVQGKCIMLTNIETKVQLLEDVVIVEADARKRNMHISVRQTAAITKPEEYVRKRIWFR